MYLKTKHGKILSTSKNEDIFKCVHMKIKKFGTFQNWVNSKNLIFLLFQSWEKENVLGAAGDAMPLSLRPAASIWRPAVHVLRLRRLPPADCHQHQHHAAHRGVPPLACMAMGRRRGAILDAAQDRQPLHTQPWGPGAATAATRPRKSGMYLVN